LGKRGGKHEKKGRGSAEPLEGGRAGPGSAREGLGEKEPSRMERRGAGVRDRGKRMRLWLALLAAFLAGAVTGWTGWEWGWLENPLRKAGRAIAGIWEKETAEGPELVFLEDPLTGRRIEGGAVNSSVAVLSDGGEVLFLAYLRWSQEGSLRVMLLPTDIKGISSRGEELSLASSLKAGEGNPAELRYLLEGVTGEALHYLFLLPVRQLPALGEALKLPPVRIEEGGEVMNPFTGARESLREGMVLRDSDRIVSYVMAWGVGDPYGKSIDRITSYLGDILAALRQMGDQGICGALIGAEGAWRIVPSSEDPGKTAELAASLIYAWSQEGTITCTGVPSIEILNGCGVVGAGTAFRRRLEARGFRVTESTRNAKVPGEDVNDFSYKASVVYVEGEDALTESYGKYIAQLFRIPRVEHRQGTGGLVIVVGSDLAEPMSE